MGKKILIIEDEKKIALAMQEFLDGQGYQTDIAMSGREAIGKCQNERFNLLVTDITLPDIDGRMVVENCLKLLPDLRVLFVTGNSNLKLKTGPRIQMIKKPCKLGEILIKIEDLLK